MADKTFNVRISLKYDSYANWTTKNPVLLLGEAAIATVPVGDTSNVSNSLPAVLIKIGDGTHNYNDLDFIQAKAADVLTACKSDTALTAYINNVISNAGIATSEAMTALSERVTTAEGDIDSLQELVGATSVSTQIANAITGLADTYATKTEAQGYADAKDAAIAAAKKAGDDAQADVDALEAKVGSVAADKTVVQMIEEAQAAATYDDTALAGRVTTAEGKLNTLIGTDTDKSVRTIANEELAAQLIPENAKASLDTLQEIAAWIQNHPDDASAMNGRISSLETLVGEDAVSTQINAAIEALKIGDYAKAADLTAAVARVTTLEGKAHEHANKALLDTYTQTEVDLADAVAKKHEHSNKTVLDGITAEKVASWDKVSEKANDADLATVAKTGNINDLIQTAGDVLIFSAGGASDI